MHRLVDILGVAVRKLIAVLCVCMNDIITKCLYRLYGIVPCSHLEVCRVKVYCYAT